MSVSPKLLEILRCPYCVSGQTRKSGADPGQLELINDSWLVCQEPDCERKYPIKEDIPVMLIDEGDKWADTSVEELPIPGPLVEPDYLKQVGSASQTATPTASPKYSKKQVALLLISLLGAIVVISGLAWWLRQKR